MCAAVWVLWSQTITSCEDQTKTAGNIVTHIPFSKPLDNHNYFFPLEVFMVVSQSQLWMCMQSFAMQMCFGNAVQTMILNCIRGQPEPHWFPYNLPKKINTQHNQQTVKQVHLAYVYIENNASALEWKNTFSVNAPETVYSDVSSAISHISSIFKYDTSRHCIRNHWFSHEDLDELIQLCLIRTEASAAG